MKHTHGIIMEAQNLRRDMSDPQIWRRAGLPRRHGSSGALPFARFSPFGDGREVVLLCGDDLSLYYKIGDDGVETLLGRVPARPLLAITSTEGMVRLLVAHKPDQYLTYGPELALRLHGSMPALPATRLVAADYNTLHGALPTVRLSGTSSGASGSQLVQADNRALTDAMTDCYDQLRQRAASLGYCSQPVVARYRLLDAAGNTIGVGPSVVLSAAEGYSATEATVMVSADGMQTLGGGRVVMPVYRPAVVAPQSLPSPWNRLVSRLVVEITDEIDPLDRSQQAPHGVQRDNQSGLVTVTAKLPGFAIGTVTDLPRLRRLGLEAMGARMRVAAEFDTPFDGGAGEPGATRIILTSGTLAEAPAINAAETLAASRRSWSAALAAGNVTVLCNPRREQSAGWSPDCFVASRSSDSTTPWRLAFSVSLSTPAGVVDILSETIATGNAPNSLSPVLSFPSRDATSLTVTFLSPDGQVYEESFPLTPLPGQDMACYGSPGMQRITLSHTVAAYLPAGGELPSRLETGVAETYLTSDLGQRLDRRVVSEGEIKRVMVVPRAGSAWDFSRLKLLFFGEGGTILSTLDASGRFNSCAPVDHRRVISPAAVCEATSASGASLLVYAGDDLVEISGRAATTIHPSLSRLLGSSDVAIGWEGVNREVWLAPDDGRHSLFRLSAEGELIGAALPGINLDTTGIAATGRFRFASDRGHLLLASPSASHDLSAEEPCESLPVRLRHRFPAPSAPSWLVTGVFGSCLRGDVTLSGDRGTEIAERLLRLRVEGALNSPVRVRLAMPRRQWLESSVTLEASADLAISGPGIEIE